MRLGLPSAPYRSTPLYRLRLPKIELSSMQPFLSLSKVILPVLSFGGEVGRTRAQVVLVDG